MPESRGGPTRQDTHTIKVLIGNPRTAKHELINFGIWDTFSGGDVDSDTTTYYPGAMGPAVSLGGRVQPQTVTVSRLYRLERDHDKMGLLLAAVGKMKMQVHRLPMDIEGNSYGKALVYNGTLKHVSPPDLDSNQSGAALLSLEMTVEGVPTLG
jgi:hypothetical protein